MPLAGQGHISVEHLGRSVKYEEVYLKDYAGVEDRGGMEMDFGCPSGCDDKTLGEIRNYRIIPNFCPEEFEMSVGRKPKSQAEFDEWAALTEKGLVNGHIDWDILDDCPCDAMTNYGCDKK